MESAHVTSLKEEIRQIVNPHDSSLFIPFNECPVCKSDQIKYFFSKYDYHYYSCSNCNFIFLNPTPRIEVLDKLYNGLLYSNIRKHIDFPRARSGLDYFSTSLIKKDALEIIQRIKTLNIEGKWLDVGGGSGSFLNLLRKEHPRFECFLFETNLLSVNFAKEYVKINVIDKWKDIQTKFDVISLIAVIEHITTPKEMLLQLKGNLSQNGILVLNIPRVTKMVHAFQDKYVNFLPPFHVSMFNKKNISFLLQACGFKLLDIWQGSEGAFQFEYLFDFIRKQDIRIPFQDTSSLEAFFDPSLNRTEQILFKISKIGNRIIKPFHSLVDDGAYLNIIAKKQ